MKLSNLFIILYASLMVFLFIFVVFAIRSRDMQIEDMQVHLVEQPCKALIFIVDESSVFERDGYLYYEIGA